jgi:hypothetical protein
MEDVLLSGVGTRNGRERRKVTPRGTHLAIMHASLENLHVFPIQCQGGRPVLLSLQY